MNGRRKEMRTKSLVILSLIILIIGSSTVLAQEKGAKEAKPQEGAMMWRAMVGAEFLHEHMNYMMQQMSSFARMMSQMMESGKMDPKMMKLMAETMGEMSKMMSEIPAVEEMMEKRPETAMKDMSKMTKTMSGVMEKMAEMMAQMTK